MHLPFGYRFAVGMTTLLMASIAATPALALDSSDDPWHEPPLLAPTVTVKSKPAPAPVAAAKINKITSPQVTPKTTKSVITKKKIITQKKAIKKPKAPSKKAAVKSTPKTATR
ncbi:hypothetical protein HYV74_03160 [Candidatus Uhrbacteria bacterium]|nr:hypothetical protein [Candidatus Uhrbacteria bacterium]